MIGEVRQRGLAHVDLADLARRQRAAFGVEDAHDAALDRPADRAGLAQGLLGGMPDRDAGLGRPIVLVDDRTPPSDHRLLDVGWTGCRPVHDEAQR